MITLTPNAAEQIKQAAKQAKMEGTALKIAAKKAEDGSLEYAIGFDDQPQDEDISVTSEGVKINVPPGCAELLNGTTMDFGEVDGQPGFIFMNPNDPNFQPADGNSDNGHLL